MMDWLNRQIFQPLLTLRSGSKHLRYLRYLQKTQFDPLEVIERRQLLAIRKVLQHAYETVPFYRERFEQIGFHPNDFNALSQLKELPILTKTDVRKNASKLLSTAFPAKELIQKRTSGSTGVPIEIRIDRTALEWKTACTLRSDEWSGWRRGQRVAKVWGNPEYRSQGWKGRLRNGWIDRAVYLDTLHLDESRLAEFVCRLQSTPPSLLFGHAHSLYLLACYLQKHPERIIRPRGIISTAMILHDWQRKTIEEVFHTPVTNRYGCEETSLIACECEHHRGFHVNADSVYVEIQDDARWEGPNPTGPMLITDLTNMAMPLIRYQVGDVGVASTRTCACGRGLPLLERVEGREADYIVTPEGRWISGISLTENFALHIPGTAQVQIIQEARNRIIFKMVADESFDESSRKAVQQRVSQTISPLMKWEIEIVDAIPQEPSGKYRFCISKIATEEMKSFAA